MLYITTILHTLKSTRKNQMRSQKAKRRWRYRSALFHCSGVIFFAANSLDSFFSGLHLNVVDGCGSGCNGAITYRCKTNKLFLKESDVKEFVTIWVYSKITIYDENIKKPFFYYIKVNCLHKKYLDSCCVLIAHMIITSIYYDTMMNNFWTWGN